MSVSGATSGLERNEICSVGRKASAPAGNDDVDVLAETGLELGLVGVAVAGFVVAEAAGAPFVS